MKTFSVPGQRSLLLIVSGLTIVLFAVTNWPWTLDDYDQAKQAFVSDQMIKQGRWLYQTTPQEGLGSGMKRHSSHHISTKPPGVGWISAAIFAVTRSWDVAWRLPAFAAGLALAWLIFRAANRAFGLAAGIVSLSAFSLNLLSPRLATIVRTDMPLALVAFAIGLLLFEKIRGERPWTNTDRWWLFALLTAGLFVKGPIVYAFVLPALALYQWRRRGRANWPTAWSGWLPWVCSLALFLGWVIAGIKYIDGFFEDVILTEFAGRFHEGVHRSQPLFFYLPHLLHKWAPWSLLAIGLGVVAWRRRRADAPMSPQMFWLIGWALGGIVVMSLIPSKRVDRIFPAIPPLCLLLGAQFASFAAREKTGLTSRRILVGAVAVAAIFTAGYSAFRIYDGYRTDRAALERFGREVRTIAAREHLDYEVRPSEDEGLLLYLQKPRFIHPESFDPAGPLIPLVQKFDPDDPTLLPLLRVAVEKKTEPRAHYGFFAPPPPK